MGRIASDTHARPVGASATRTRLAAASTVGRVGRKIDARVPALRSVTGAENARARLADGSRRAGIPAGAAVGAVVRGDTGVATGQLPAGAEHADLAAADGATRAPATAAFPLLLALSPLLLLARTRSDAKEAGRAAKQQAQGVAAGVPLSHGADQAIESGVFHGWPSLRVSLVATRMR